MDDKTVVERIVDFVFGYKYYANIINTRGVAKYELCCFIFQSKEEAIEHRNDLNASSSFAYIETISFRSRKKYPKVIRKEREKRLAM